jgi:hypothetical protein
VSHLSAHRSTCCRRSAGTDVVPIPSSTNAFRTEHRQFPGVGSLIVANELRQRILGFRYIDFHVSDYS